MIMPTTPEIHSDGRPMVHPESREEWRAWLAAHHDFEESVWMVFWKKPTGKSAPTYAEAVEEALCFGWVDSSTRRVDDERAMYYFSPRNPKSTWSRANKERVERLIADGRMTDAGMALIEAAKENGYWTIFDEIEDLIIPADLAAALDSHADAARYFDAFPVSAKKNILWWITPRGHPAKRPATRLNRITKTATLAAHNRMANHPAGHDQGPSPGS